MGDIIIIPNREKIPLTLYKKVEEFKKHYGKVQNYVDMYRKTHKEEYLEEAVRLLLENKQQCTLSYIERRLCVSRVEIKKVLENMQKEGYAKIENNS